MRRGIFKKILLSFAIVSIIMATFVGYIVYITIGQYSNANSLYEEVNDLYKKQTNFPIEAKRQKNPEVYQFAKEFTFQLEKISPRLAQFRKNIDAEDKDIIEIGNLLTKILNGLKVTNEHLKNFGVFAKGIKKGQLNKADRLIDKTLKDPNAKDFNDSKKLAQQALDIYQKIKKELNRFSNKFKKVSADKIIKTSKEYIGLKLDIAKTIIEACNVGNSSASKYNHLVSKINSYLDDANKSKYSDAQEFLNNPIDFVESQTLDTEVETTMILNQVKVLLDKI